MFNFILLFLAYIFDVFITTLLNFKTVGFYPSITSNILIITLIVITFKEDVKYSMFLGLVIGFILDLHGIDYHISNQIILVLLTLIVSIWSTRINTTFIELFFLVLAALFLKELFLYIINIIVNSYRLSVLNWVVNHLSYTIFSSLLPTFIIVYIKMQSENRNQIKLAKDAKVSKSRYQNY